MHRLDWHPQARAEAHDQNLVAAFELLPLQWTSKSIRALTTALLEKGHQFSDFMVRRLLREGGYSLQATVKITEGAATKHRQDHRGDHPPTPG